MNPIRTYPAFLAAAAAAALLVSGCGSGNSSGAASTSGGSSTAQTVSLRKVDGVGDVLVDAKGAALYSADQEEGGKVLCTGSCTSIWLPLTLSAGAAGPTASGALRAGLGTITRPDGATQVTFDGKPVYRFAEDGRPANVSGNGISDSFDGTAFTWHVARPRGASGESTSTGSGGYGY
jgi:predicted lipoprotein with Yx(FWY)xxD motif